MVSKSKTAERSEEERAARLSSPVRGLRPRSDQLVTLALADIEADETNPGNVTTSKRDERRLPSMLDSFDILDGLVYPIVVCEHPDKPGKFMHVDGLGRIQMLRGRGVKEIRAIVYPPMTLEQRICFRQTLNAAQEPFDPVSIIHDLKLLAAERGLSLQKPADVKTLVADMPARVRKAEKDLLLLTRWHEDVVDRMGEDYGDTDNVIGLDQIRSLTRLLDVLSKRHPGTVMSVGGERTTSLLLGQLFFKQHFADGMRSQEGIRKATTSVKTLAAESNVVAEFVNGAASLSELVAAQQAQAADPDQGGSPPPDQNLIHACQELTGLLIAVDANDLSDQAKRALERTQRVLEGVV